MGPVPGWESQDYEPFYDDEDGLIAYISLDADKR